MTSLVTPEYWKMWLGDMPMPEDATTDMMWAAHDAMQEFEARDEDIRMINWYEESKKHYVKKREFWLPRTNEPDYVDKLRIYDNILEQIDEGIEFLREQLNG